MKVECLKGKHTLVVLLKTSTQTYFAVGTFSNVCKVMRIALGFSKPENISPIFGLRRASEHLLPWS